MRAQGSVEGIDRHGLRLSGAETLRAHAEAIQEWPFDSATFIQVLAIATSVTTVIISRLIFLALGL